VVAPGAAQAVSPHPGRRSLRDFKRLNCQAIRDRADLAWRLQCSVVGRPRLRSNTHPHRRQNMLHYAVVFFVIALIAAVFGFGGIAAGAVEIAKILFFVFLVIAAITFVMSLLRKR